MLYTCRPPPRSIASKISPPKEHVVEAARESDTSKEYPEFIFRRRQGKIDWRYARPVDECSRTFYEHVLFPVASRTIDRVDLDQVRRNSLRSVNFGRKSDRAFPLFRLFVTYVIAELLFALSFACRLLCSLAGEHRRTPGNCRQRGIRRVST